MNFVETVDPVHTRRVLAAITRSLDGSVADRRFWKEWMPTLERWSAKCRQQGRAAAQRPVDATPFAPPDRGGPDAVPAAVPLDDPLLQVAFRCGRGLAVAVVSPKALLDMVARAPGRVARDLDDALDDHDAALGRAARTKVLLVNGSVSTAINTLRRRAARGNVADAATRLAHEGAIDDAFAKLQADFFLHQAWHLKLNEAPRAEEEATIFLRVLFAKARDAQTDGAETDDYDDDARDDEIVDLCDSPPDLADVIEIE